MFEPATSLRIDRLVVRLARMHEDDVAAVLGSLGEEARRRVEMLLHQRNSGTIVEERNKADLRLLSPWLRARIHSGTSDAETIMTARAHEALRAAAERVLPPSSGVPERPPSLASRLLGALHGARQP